MHRDNYGCSSPKYGRSLIANRASSVYDGATLVDEVFRVDDCSVHCQQHEAPRSSRYRQGEEYCGSGELATCIVDNGSFHWRMDLGV